MIKEEKGITDSVSAAGLSLKDKHFSPVSYTKTNKLITALYMVTDIMDSGEPLRIKLRTLGLNIISDLHSNFLMEKRFLQKVIERVDEIVSFLGICETLNLISEMNSNILIKEFLELKESIKALNPDGTLSLFFKEEEVLPPVSPVVEKRHVIGQKKFSSIGVQKGNTLMKALSDKVSALSDRREDMNALKGQRREEIIKIIKDGSNNTTGLTITDIHTLSKELKDKLDIKALTSCGEKTLQRELASMVTDNVLNKAGSKRWSRYFLAKA